ncbi:hypothetical protein RSK20926_15486 [Roseobacter sp. SK209-2-6]|nr:hypothetical protein RSK20926_15486 [Roseobacter sp. SK209-2-6]
MIEGGLRPVYVDLQAENFFRIHRDCCLQALSSLI